jgi:hypothetical protein
MSAFDDRLPEKYLYILPFDCVQMTSREFGFPAVTSRMTAA